jgi:hypothetical protein
LATPTLTLMMVKATRIMVVIGILHLLSGGLPDSDPSIGA